VRLLDIQTIGNELAVKWDDGTEQFILLSHLRRACPCADCQGEPDLLGNICKTPKKPLAVNAFELVSIARVGGYAIQPAWADGHDTGIYSFEYLRRMMPNPV
jgi:DUF971 family protein